MELIDKLEGHSDTINQACILDAEDGVLSISQDKTIRIWLKRERGSYWPSVCHLLAFAPTCFHFDQPSLRMFVGLESGTITEFKVSNDFNRIEQHKYFTSHQGKVSALLFSSTLKWLLSVGRDAQVHWNDSETGNRLATYNLPNPSTAIQFDAPSKYAFVSEQNGVITMLKLDHSNNLYHFKFVTTLNGHQTAIKSLLWEPTRNWLFSAGSDHLIICWDIGGRKGSTYELNGHRAKVTSLCFSKSNNTLLSAGEDCKIIAWSMSVKRDEAPQWSEADNCQRCNRPFFWNFKLMYETKQMGLRQHHCRYCGRAVCDDCSHHRTTIPPMGFEYEVRVCVECFPLFSDASRKPLAKIFNAMHHVNCMDLSESKQLILTTGYDRTIMLRRYTTVNQI